MSVMIRDQLNINMHRIKKYGGNILNVVMNGKRGLSIEQMAAVAQSAPNRNEEHQRKTKLCHK